MLIWREGLNGMERKSGQTQIPLIPNPEAGSNYSSILARAGKVKRLQKKSLKPAEVGSLRSKGKKPSSLSSKGKEG